MPYSKRKPTSTAMIAVLIVATSSRAKAERNDTLRTLSVASRNWSQTRAMTSTCALAWPKSLRVVSPCRLSRKCEASRPSVSVLMLGTRLRAAADHPHEEWYQRRSEQKDQPRDDIQREHGDENAEGNEHADEELRQILTEIWIQRFDALGRGGRQFGGPFAAGVCGSQGHHVLEQSPAHIGLDADGGLTGRNFGSSYKQPAGRRNSEQQQSTSPKRGAVVGGAGRRRRRWS